MKLRRIVFVVACAALGCNETPDTTSLTSPRREVDHPEAPQRGPVAASTRDEQRAIAGVTGVRAEAAGTLRGDTKTRLDGAITSAPVTRMSSASYSMISTLRTEVE